MWLAALVVLLLIVIWPVRGTRRRGEALFYRTGPQWRRNYGRRAFLRLGLALGAAAVLAYSGADETLEKRHAALGDPSVRDGAAKAVKPMGERELFLVWGLAALGDWLWKSSPFTRWGRSTFEAMCVGLPVLWTVQRTLGSNRPRSLDATPRWQPMAHAHAASGHAFMAAIPWWTLAGRMSSQTSYRVLRFACRAAGLLTGWSRLNDRMHYPSQILLGWVIAGNAVAAVQPGRDRDDGPQAAEQRTVSNPPSNPDYS